MTASAIYRSPLYAGQLNSKYKGRVLGSCSVTVIYRVTAIYRAVIYRFDCITHSIVILKSSQSLFSEALSFCPKCSQNAVKQSFHEGEFFTCVCGRGEGVGWGWQSCLG